MAQLNNQVKEGRIPNIIFLMAEILEILLNTDKRDKE